MGWAETGRAAVEPRPAGRTGGRRSWHAPRSVVLALLLLLALAPLAVGHPAAAQDDGVDAQDPGIVPVDQAVPAEVVPGPEAVAPDPGYIPDPNWVPPSTVYVAETGHTLDRLFLDMWRGWGGANTFGYPITPEFEENGHIVQYLGYARFEYWPEDPDNPVHLGDVGRELRPPPVRRTQHGVQANDEAARAARAWLPLDPDRVGPDSEEWRFVPATGHSVSGGFKWLWEYTGEETYLGNPLSEEYIVQGITYQVFERGQMAWEPGVDPYLMPVGELLARRYGLDTSPVWQGDVPTYSEDLFVPPPMPEPEPLLPAVDPNAPRSLEVSISAQYAWARQGDVVLWEGYVSTGKVNFETPTGTYFVNSKIPSQSMEGVLGGEYYNVPDVPHVMYFTDRGHAIHGTYWHANFGMPMSHGCVNLPMDVAAWMYDWAPLGMLVTITP